MKINTRQYFKFIATIILFEVFSFFAYAFPDAAWLINVGVFLVATILTVYRLEYGVMLAIAELLIGSKGYLFSQTIFGFTLSVRMSLWLLVMLRWFGIVLYRRIRRQNLKIAFCLSRLNTYFFILFFFIAWSALNGLFEGYSLGVLYSDFNNWLFFLLIFPVYDAFAAKKDKLAVLLSLIAACLSWQIFETIALLYLFTHAFGDFLPIIYRWIRNTGVGEITRLNDGFYRVFFQSQIFFLPAFLFALWTAIGSQRNSGRSLIQNLSLGFLGIGSFAVILISLSRSFWTGLAIALLLVSALGLQRKKLAILARLFQSAAVLSAGAFLLLIIAVKFPWPSVQTEFSASKILKDRASSLTDEAAAASRWQLLPVMLDSIAQAPILGQGFGKTLTYESEDPRVLESRPGGSYTTYAFEWGWLSFWLKLGLMGSLAYCLLLFMICRQVYLKNTKSILPRASHSLIDQAIDFAIIFGLVSLAGTHFFSPYLDHPLGIGLVVLAALFSESEAGKKYSKNDN